MELDIRRSLLNVFRRSAVCGAVTDVWGRDERMSITIGIVVGRIGCS